jgi:5,10-methylenetetrahydrofolate reductase
MVRSLDAALVARPLVFEPVPPSLRTAGERLRRYVDEVVRQLGPIERVDAVDIPELVDENHDGKPYYRTRDPRAFAHEIGERTGRAVFVNKVVAHLPSPSALEGWVRETIDRGIRNVVLVGGSSRYIPYPGPAVIDANRVAGEILRDRGGRVGNITIPQRVGEAHRMLAKTEAGASFFTTQILFDGEAVKKMLRDYDRLCRQAGRPPATVLLSLAPLSDEDDAEFVRWLGADIPDSAEKAILNGDDAESGERSIENALRVWTEVAEDARARGIAVPLGVNVEQITARHLTVAISMLREFSNAIDRGRGADAAPTASGPVAGALPSAP